jgi:hypothetical protein
VPKIGNGGLAEGALRALGKEVVLTQCVEDGTDMSEVFRPGGAVDEYVIEENKDKPSQVWVQHVVHKSLKRCWGVCETEGHHEKLEKALVCAKCRLLNVRRMHQHLVITRPQVELAKEFCTMELIEEFIHHWDGELVFDGLVIEGAIVHAKTRSIILLLDKEYR